MVSANPLKELYTSWLMGRLVRPAVQWVICQLQEFFEEISTLLG